MLLALSMVASASLKNPFGLAASALGALVCGNVTAAIFGSMAVAVMWVLQRDIKTIALQVVTSMSLIAIYTAIVGPPGLSTASSLRPMVSHSDTSRRRARRRRRSHLKDARRIAIKQRKLPRGVPAPLQCSKVFPRIDQAKQVAEESAAGSAMLEAQFGDRSQAESAKESASTPAILAEASDDSDRVKDAVKKSAAAAATAEVPFQDVKQAKEVADESVDTPGILQGIFQR